MRLKFLVAYDGAPFCGWQSQAGGNTVQDVLEAAVAKIACQPIRIHAAGRTDAGVHSVGQCCHADLPDGRLTPEVWCRALNAVLPPTIRITGAQTVGTDFHARFSATGKIYVYRIWNDAILPPHEVNRAWRVTDPISLPALRETLRLFQGHHDFAAFSANRGHPPASTHRTISRAACSSRGRLITLRFEGDGFLYKMVRMLTAAAVDGALGKVPRETLQNALQNAQPKWTRVAPPGGLTLQKVFYKKNTRSKQLSPQL